MAAALGPLLVRADPLAIDLTQVLAPPGRGHWLGCDALGRDMLARVLWGARLSLTVSTTVVLLSLAAGSVVGGVAALAGGRVDSIVMRLVDVVLAFPGFLLAIALAAILGPGLVDLVVALTAMGWTGLRATGPRRSAVAARARVRRGRARTGCGAAPPVAAPSDARRSAGPVAVQATFGVGGIIVAEAALFVPGTGRAAAGAEWGNMLDSGRAFMLSSRRI